MSTLDQLGNSLLPTDKCKWCGRPGAYMAGTKCISANREVLACPTHQRWTDPNLVARGRRCAVKCAHYMQGAVVLWANPSADDDPWISYMIQFYWPGLGEEQYTIVHGQGTCPHATFDSFVLEMRKGVRPNPSHVPPVQPINDNEAANGC